MIRFYYGGHYYNITKKNTKIIKGTHLNHSSKIDKSRKNKFGSVMVHLILIQYSYTLRY